MQYLGVLLNIPKGEKNLNFIESLIERTKAYSKKTIVLPETDDIRTLKAAEKVLKKGFANIILAGKPDAIKELGKDCDLTGAEIFDITTSDKADLLAEELYNLRKDKGMTLEAAKKLLLDDYLFVGNMLVKLGMADGMVAGAVRSTPDVMRASLQVLKTAPGIKVVSAFFIEVVPDCKYGHNGIFLYADSGLMQNPNSEELAAIAVSSAKSFKQLVGAEPVVAMLSHSTKGSAKHPDVDKVVEATRIAKELAPDLAVDGELQFDAAIIPEIGQKKAPGSTVAGHANVMVFPDLDAGNICYKVTERLAKAEAYGPITQGLSKPVNDLSRGCNADDIYGVCAVTAVQAQ